MRRIGDLASLVPCGIASPLPMWVDTDSSRSCIDVDVRRVDGADVDQQPAGLGDRRRRGCVAVRRARRTIASEHVRRRRSRRLVRRSRCRRRRTVSISSTISSYRGLPMKLSTETWIGRPGPLLGSVGEVLVADDDVVGRRSRLAIDLLTTVTSRARRRGSSFAAPTHPSRTNPCRRRRRRRCRDLAWLPTADRAPTRRSTPCPSCPPCSPVAPVEVAVVGVCPVFSSNAATRTRPGRHRRPPTVMPTKSARPGSAS